MKLVKGFWIPDYDENLANDIDEAKQFAGRATYQLEAFQRVFPLIKNFGTALDIGAHVGLWTVMLTPCFSRVIAFEPVAEHAECFKRNTNGKVFLHQIALGEKDALETMSIRAPNSLKACVYANVTKDKPRQIVKMHRLDSVLDIDGPIDLIKIDCEGYESFVVKGAEKTIKKHKPAIVVEQKKRHVHYGAGPREAVEILKSWGAVYRFDSHNDYFMSWD